KLFKLEPNCNPNIPSTIKNESLQSYHNFKKEGTTIPHFNFKDLKGVKLGRLSGIVAHYVPKYLLKNRLPSWETNCIEDWETKVNAIVEETFHENMSVISGIPSWVQMYFEKLYEKNSKTRFTRL
ncbi:MAG: hypothetical protein RJB10_1764, partial [Pseudomonadota bacterium]